MARHGRSESGAFALSPLKRTRIAPLTGTYSADTVRLGLFSCAAIGHADINGRAAIAEWFSSFDPFRGFRGPAIGLRAQSR